MAPHPDSMLILEQDDSLLDRDRRCRYARTRAAGTTSLRYEHRRNATDQLLGIPDAIAWSWARGGTGDGASLRWSPRSATSEHSEQREARLTDRPDGCRAHFSPLLRQARPVQDVRRHCPGRTPSGGVAVPWVPRTSSRSAGATRRRASCRSARPSRRPYRHPAARPVGLTGALGVTRPRGPPPGAAGVPPRAGPPRPPGQRRHGRGSPPTCGPCADPTRSSPR